MMVLDCSLKLTFKTVLNKSNQNDTQFWYCVVSGFYFCWERFILVSINCIMTETALVYYPTNNPYASFNSTSMYKEYRAQALETRGGPLVSLTDSCSLRGKIEYHPGGQRPVNAFLGVPFAAPPVGERRFQPTQPVQLWQREREAVKFGECLLLNVTSLVLWGTYDK